MTSKMTTLERSGRRTISTVSLRAALAAAGILALAGHSAAVEAAKRPQTVPAGLTTGQRGQAVTPVPCNSVGSCNQIISYCAENGGNWMESSHDGQGRPSAGVCYLP